MSTRFISRQPKSISSYGEFSDASKYDNILEAKKRIGMYKKGNTTTSINEGDVHEEFHTEEELHDIDLSFDENEMTLRELFEHSGSGSLTEKLGRYQKGIISLMLILCTLNGFVFYGVQSFLIIPPNEYHCEKVMNKTCYLNPPKLKGEQIKKSSCNLKEFIIKEVNQCKAVKEEYF